VSVVLADGTYDVLVVDATATEVGALELDLTILAGPQRGEVVSMRAEGLAWDEVGVLGIPGTLVVRGGEPSLALEH
jgi:hypothetical protein